MIALREDQIPREFRIGGDDWKLVFVDRVDKDDNWGECDDVERLIKLKSGMKPDQLMKILIHELLHAIEFSWGREFGHPHIYVLQHSVWQLMRDNF